MKILSVSLVLIIVFSSCIKEDPVAASQGYSCNSFIINSHPKEAFFDSIIEEQYLKGLPGISMLIETNVGIWTGASGLADIPNQVPMQSCSAHKLGSTTKVLTSTLIFLLYEEGLLDFNDLLIDHLDDDLINKIANYKTVSIKNLLNHSSGIPNYLDIAYTLNYYDDLTRVWTDIEELELIYNEEAVFEPGEFADYSNTNYLLLGLIAKKLSGKSGGELIQERIFDPLGMNESYFNEDGSIPSNLVRGYYDENGKGNFIDITKRGFARHSLAGGASSNVEDLHTLIKTFWTTDILVTDETRDEIFRGTSPPFLNPDPFTYGDNFKVKKISRIGLGWFQMETEAGIGYGHDGGYDGRRSVMRYFPEKDAFITYLINGSGESITPTLRQLRRNEIVNLIMD